MQLKSFIMAFMPVMVLFSCDEEGKNVPEGPIGTSEITFTATAEQTKTILQDGLSVCWCSGDQISVYGTDEPFKTDVPDNSVEADFSGPSVIAIDGKFNAVYPFSALKGWSSAGVAEMLFPEVQEAVPGSFANGANLSFAQCGETERKMMFHNIPAYIRFTVGKTSGNIKTVSVSAGDGEFLSGLIGIECTDGTVKVLEGKQSVRLESDSALSEGEYYMAILPGTFEKNLKIKVTSTEGYVVEDVIPESTEILSGYVYSVDELTAKLKVVAEFENGTLEGDAKKESPTGEDLTPGDEDVFVNIANSGVSVELDVPEDGRYRIELIYRTHGEVGSFKPNKLEVKSTDGNNGQIFYERVIDFKANAVPELMNVGTYDLKAGKIQVRASKFWGWSAFDKVILTKTDEPAELYQLYDAGIPENGAAIGDGHLDLKLGTVSYKFNIPAAGAYRLITEAISYGDVTNTIAIENVLNPVTFEVLGLQADYEVVAGDFTCDAAKEISVKFIANQENKNLNMCIRSVRIIPID